ncbi:MAG: methylenetetrahydrofolate reductase [Candidatus Thermoplasmatota archaeon]|nr:methylenetetrahydrofolate reductase [Candidatus Thermoplasmatota archaeon]MCL5790891.1 methylenetetrahydrofolate reductase [Candidatus Thermoplasmatota archaeon]
MPEDKLVTDLKFVKSVEILPDKKFGIDDLKKAAKILDGVANVVTAPENPGGRPGIDPFFTTRTVSSLSHVIAVPHLSTRDKNRVFIISQIISAIKDGIRNFFVVGGDPIDASISTFEVRELDVIGLIREIRRVQLEDYGGRLEINIGAAFNPYRTIEKEVSMKKMESGTDFFMTQPVYSPGHFDPELMKVRNFRIIPGFIPIRSKGAIDFLKRMGVNLDITDVRRLQDSDDIASLSRRMFLDAFEEIRGYSMGIHVMPMGDYKMARELLESI